jgi:peptidylprolyl isomerase
VRTLLPITVVAAATMLLAACSGTPSGTTTSTAAAGCSAPKAGSVSKSVTVTGDLGAAPTVDFDKPLKAKSFQRSYAVKGDGAAPKKSDVLEVKFYAYNGKTGDELTGGGLEMPIGLDSGNTLPVYNKMVACAPVKSRTVTTSTVKQAFGSQDVSGLGLKSSDAIVFVADIQSVLPTKADGAPQTPQAGFPTVTLAKNGKPTVTIPKSDPPTTTSIEVLKKGTGEAVQDGDTVTVQYQGVNWRTGKVFDQSWGRSIASFSTSGVVPGFKKALVGQTVGSQVVAVIPPADGYGSDGNSQAGIKGTDTLVFVIDILNTTR